MLLAFTSRSTAALCGCGSHSVDITYDRADSSRLALQCQRCFKWSPCPPETAMAVVEKAGGLQIAAANTLRQAVSPEAKAV